MIAMQTSLIKLHRTLIKEMDDAHISNSTPSEVPIRINVLLEPVSTPIKKDGLTLAAQGLP